MDTQKKYSIVIYGASGFTGKLCVKYMSKNYPQLKWAIAGRSKEKLEEVNKEFEIDKDIIVADSFDMEALNAMTSATQVVLSLVGPYNTYGHLLIESCILNKTHYADITGETFFTKQIIDKYFDTAKQNGVRIVNSCGYDSLPSDLGLFMALSKCNKPVTRACSYTAAKGTFSGGTFKTAVTQKLPKDIKVNDPFLLTPEDRITQNQRENTPSPDLVENFYKNLYGGKSIFAGINSQNVRRSIAFLRNTKNYHQDLVFQEYGSYVGKNKARVTSALLGIANKVGGCAQVRKATESVMDGPLKNIANKVFPAPGTGPTEKQREEGWLKHYFVCSNDEENRTFLLSASGDPGYKNTSKMAVECAIVLSEVFEENDAPFGVLPPAVALGKPLVRRLNFFQFEELK